MRYATLGGGKRFRPFLLIETAALFGVTQAQALPAATAVECVHCYSLVHDDLPAMDDDDMRRGRPTVHKAFDEATAILAGDALLTLAFEILGRPQTDPDPAVRADLVLGLARAAGWQGMVGGQMLDLIAEHTPTDLQGVILIESLKTSALIEFSVIAGALLGRSGPAERQALGRYARALGLAFQIADDLLDAEGDAAEVGKATAKDAASGKATFISLLGIEASRAKLKQLEVEAVGALDAWDSKADVLREAARFVVQRRS
jgi:farnesyl diphosphate synthase